MEREKTYDEVKNTNPRLVKEVEVPTNNHAKEMLMFGGSLLGLPVYFRGKFKHARMLRVCA
jgi:hypothetical protein